MGIVLFMQSHASALGIGVYGNIRNNWSTINADYADITPPITNPAFEDQADATRTIYSFGFILDTAVSTDSIFNYRLQLGYGFGSLKIDGTYYSETIDINEFQFYNTFGFGIVRSQYVRIWLGPQIGLGYGDGEYTYLGESNYYGDIFISLGAVLGFNIHLGGLISLSIDGGIRETLIFSLTSSSDDLWLYYNKYYSVEVFADVAVLFRFE